MSLYSKGSSSAWVLVVLAAILLGIGGISAMRTVKDNRYTLSAEEMKKYEHVRGNPEAKVVLEEYADFQCPACADTYPIVDRIVASTSAYVKYVYEPFPLRNIHKNADISTQAAEAAGLQGKYFEMAKLLYERQEKWELSMSAKKVFTDYAGEIGLDKNKFVADIDSRLVKSIVETYYKRAMEAKIESTPTFILNGTRIQPIDEEDFYKTVTDAVEESLKTVPQNTTPLPKK